MQNNCNNPIVTIRCWTFNQKPYIRQCLNGFVMQKTDFPFFAVVVDDASTDGEQEVLWDCINNELDTTSFQKDETDDFVRVVAPNKTNNHCIFIIILLKYNHYSIRKAKRPYFKDWENKTKYIAHCEGDDYWIDPQKLQKQVDYLDSHPDYGMVYTNYKMYYQETGQTEISQCVQTSLEDELTRNRVATLSTMVRSSLVEKYIQYIGNIPKERGWMMGDYPTWIFVMANSKAKLIPDVTAVYRVLKNSASHFTSFKKNKDFLLSTYDICFFFADKYNVSYNVRKTIANNEINDLLSLAKKYNTNLHFPLLKFMIENNIFSLKKYFTAKLRLSVLGRRIYNRLKTIIYR